MKIVTMAQVQKLTCTKFVRGEYATLYESIAEIKSSFKNLSKKNIERISKFEGKPGIVGFMESHRSTEQQRIFEPIYVQEVNLEERNLGGN